MPTPDTLTTRREIILKAVKFAVAEAGPLGGGVTPRHLMDAGALLSAATTSTPELLALLAKAYEIMLAATEVYDA